MFDDSAKSYIKPYVNGRISTTEVRSLLTDKKKSINIGRGVIYNIIFYTRVYIE